MGDEPEEDLGERELQEVYRAKGSPCPLFPQYGVSLLAGASGVGKTALYAGWLREMLGGGDILGRPAMLKPGALAGVLIADRGMANNRHWFEREGIAGHERLVFYSIVDDVSFQAEKLRMAGQHPKLFERCLDHLALPEDSFLVVDPFSLFAGSKLNDYSATAAALIPLQRILKKRKLTCLGVHHTSKMKADPKMAYVRPQDQILGSMALAGYTDTQLYIKGPEETNQPHYVVGYVSHTETPKVFKLVRDKLGRFRLGNRQEALKLKLKSSTLLGVLGLVSLDGSPTMMLLQEAQGMGLGRATTFRALGKLVALGALEKDGHGRYKRIVGAPKIVDEPLEPEPPEAPMVH